MSTSTHVNMSTYTCLLLPFTYFTPIQLPLPDLAWFHFSPGISPNVNKILGRCMNVRENSGQINKNQGASQPLKENPRRSVIVIVMVIVMVIVIVIIRVTVIVFLMVRVIVIVMVRVIVIVMVTVIVILIVIVIVIVIVMVVISGLTDSLRTAYTRSP